MGAAGWSMPKRSPPSTPKRSPPRQGANDELASLETGKAVAAYRDVQLAGNRGSDEFKIKLDYVAKLEAEIALMQREEKESLGAEAELRAEVEDLDLELDSLHDLEEIAEEELEMAEEAVDNREARVAAMEDDVDNAVEICEMMRKDELGNLTRELGAITQEAEDLQKELDMLDQLQTFDAKEVKQQIAEQEELVGRDSIEFGIAQWTHVNKCLAAQSRYLRKETHGIRRELSRLEQRETDVSDTSDFGEELGQVHSDNDWS